MDQILYWVPAGGLFILAFALVVGGFNERRLRRRERALGTRRKTRIAL